MRRVSGFKAGDSKPALADVGLRVVALSLLCTVAVICIAFVSQMGDGDSRCVDPVQSPRFEATPARASGSQLQISSVNDISGLPTYVAGMSLTVQVTLTNSGGDLPVQGGDIGLSFAGPVAITAANVTGLTVPAGGSIVVNVTAMVSISSVSGSCTIDASFSGVEGTTGNPIVVPGAILTETIHVQSASAVSIVALALAPHASPGPYFYGESFTLTATFANTGGTAATVDATIDDGAYTGLSWDDPGAVVVPEGSTASQDFTIEVVSGTAVAVTIMATWTGTEAISGRAISGDTPPDTIPVNIYWHGVSITSLAAMSPRAAPGPYVGGETLTLRVTFANTGPTSVTADATVDDGTYTGLTFSDPAAVTVAAGGTSTQDHAITIATGAPTAAVTLAATWTGTIIATGRPISGGTPADTLAINIQARAAVSITSLVITSPRPAPGSYIGGETLTLRVTFQNTGGTRATVDATLDDGAYTGITFGNPASVTINAGSTSTQEHLLTLAAGAMSGSVTITAVWTGIEAYSGRAMSGDSPPDTIAILIGSGSVSITSLAIIAPRVAPGPYVGGETLTLRVTFANTGSLGATVDGTLDAGAYTWLSFNDPAAVTVAADTTMTQDHLITISAGATTAAVTLTVTWTGTEAITGRPLSGDPTPDTILVNIQARANVAITGLSISSPRWNPGPYISGETITLRVTFLNTGGTQATVDATVDDGSYTGLTFPNPAAVIVNAGGTATQDHVITAATGAATAAVA
ncbi:MAG: hypothetical protein JW839_04465, partial [Candidatus Lokiarchaeota archaeon]|nr:hypothetical protein [Candidatus Lokiarchaeota archaeon]